MVTHHTAGTHTDNPRVAAAALRLYFAECALHDAHQSHVDEWITAAGDRLHEAVVEHLAAQASTLHGDDVAVSDTPQTGAIPDTRIDWNNLDQPSPGPGRMSIHTSNCGWVPYSSAVEERFGEPGGQP